jgi:transposase
LTDAEWALLEPLLPTDPPRGGRWRDHRTIISGILFRERTGVAPQVRTVLRLLGAPDPLPEE